MMKNRLRFTVILIISLLAPVIQGQQSAVKWYTIQEAERLAKTNPRPIVIDTYTDWCGWCKKLDQETFTNPAVAEIMNSKFYPVKFNAEGKEPVMFLGRSFINDGKSGKSHQFAIALLQGRMSYPNLVFFNENLQLLTNVPGYREAGDMEMLLNFFAEKAYEKMNFQDYGTSIKGKVQ